VKPIAPAATATPAANFVTFTNPFVTALSKVRNPKVALLPAPSSFLKSSYRLADTF
jgi:hypothetical protein